MLSNCSAGCVFATLPPGTKKRLATNAAQKKAADSRTRWRKNQIAEARMEFDATAFTAMITPLN